MDLDIFDIHIRNVREFDGGRFVVNLLDIDYNSQKYSVSISFSISPNMRPHIPIYLSPSPYSNHRAHISDIRKMMALTSVTLFRRHSDGVSLSSSGQRKRSRRKGDMTRKSRPGCRGCRRFDRVTGQRTRLTNCEVCSVRLALTPNGTLSEPDHPRASRSPVMGKSCRPPTGH